MYCTHLGAVVRTYGRDHSGGNVRGPQRSPIGVAPIIQLSIHIKFVGGHAGCDPAAGDHRVPRIPFHFDSRHAAQFSHCVISFRIAQARKIGSEIARELNAPVSSGSHQGILAVLFMTGLTSMGMEVIWIRLYTPFVGVMVYSFALILVTYLSATFLGSFAYRSFARNPESKTWVPLAALSLLAVLPVFACQPGHMNFLVRVLLGIAPFSAAVGYLTPQLVDLWSTGDADRAAHAYAVNVLGCILGPLLSGFILLPLISERWSLFSFAAPWILIGFSNYVRHYSTAAVWTKRIAAICFLTLTLVVTLKPKATRAFMRDGRVER